MRLFPSCRRPPTREACAVQGFATSTQARPSSQAVSPFALIRHSGPMFASGPSSPGLAACQPPLATKGTAFAQLLSVGLEPTSHVRCKAHAGGPSGLTAKGSAPPLCRARACTAPGASNGNGQRRRSLRACRPAFPLLRKHRSGEGYGGRRTTVAGGSWRGTANAADPL